ncbi:response regulator [bacterium]|nr:response regulator [bacterium]
MVPHVIVCATEAHLTRALALHLMRSDLDVWTASSVPALIEQFDRVRPQILIIDLDLPEEQLARLWMPGGLLAEEPHVRVIGLTSRPLDDVLDVRYARVLAKPISPRMLRRIVLDHLKVLPVPKVTA